MNYDSDELRSKLSAEYVLGTLHGKARLRFERLLQKDIKLRDHLIVWERQLSPLSIASKPVTPPDRTWQSIVDRIEPKTTKKPSLWQRVGFWRSIGFTATAAVLVLAIQLTNVIRTDTVIQYQYVTLLSNDQAKAAWLVRVFQNTGKMTVQALNVKNPGFAKAFELWMLPDGQPPKSLGLMPVSGERTIELTSPLIQVLNNSKAFAVSLEPSNGSPTRAPTGPVLFQVKNFPCKNGSPQNFFDCN